MADIKELRSIELSSFTTMNAGISVIFAIIAAIVSAISITLLIPEGAGFAVYLIPTIIVASFIISIYTSFSSGLFYNLLAPKLKTIAVIIDKDEIKKISTTETAMMVSIILTIHAILFYLVSVITLPLLLSSVMQTLMYSGQQMIAYSLYQLLTVISQPITIALFIFGTFIISFVFVLLGTYIYNILGKKDRGIVLKLDKENNLTSIESIDALKLAIVCAIISGILNIILAIINIISGGAATTAISNIISGFVGGFIEFYLFAKFYNFLAPKLGKVKLELIDFKIN